MFGINSIHKKYVRRDMTKTIIGIISLQLMVPESVIEFFSGN
jgi:hypothetical protein